MRKLRFGLVGAGPWGARLAGILQEHRDVEIVAACRRSSVRPEWLPTSAVMYNNTPHMLDGTKLDAVVIATSPDSAAAIAIEVAARGIAVLVEKPVATHILSLADLKPRAAFLVAHQHTFAPRMAELRALRDIQHVSVIAGGPGPVRRYSAIFDYGAHAVSSALWVTKACAAAVFRTKLQTGWLPRNTCGPYSFYGRTWMNGVPVSIVVGNNLPEKTMIVNVRAGNKQHVYDGNAFVPSEDRPVQRMLDSFISSVAFRTYDARFDPYGVDFARAVTASLASFHAAPPQLAPLRYT